MTTGKKRTVMIAAVLFALLAFSTCSYSQEGLKISGYIKSYFTHDETMSRTKVTNARFKISGQLNDNTDYGIQVDGVRDDILLDAYINRKIMDGLSATIGQYKTPYSTENLTHNGKTQFINRPYMLKEASPHFRDTGIKLTYNHQYVDAIVAVMNGSGQNENEFNNNKSMAYRVVAKIMPQLNLSANYYTGKTSKLDNETDDFINVGAHGTISGFSYAGEFAQKKRGALTNTALYAWLAYDFDVDSDLVNILTPTARIEMADPDVDTDDDGKSRYTIGVIANFEKKYADRIIIDYEIRDVETGEVDNLFGIEYIVMF